MCAGSKGHHQYGTRDFLMTQNLRREAYQWACWFLRMIRKSTYVFQLYNGEDNTNVCLCVDKNTSSFSFLVFSVCVLRHKVHIFLLFLFSRSSSFQRLCSTCRRDIFAFCELYQLAVVLILKKKSPDDQSKRTNILYRNILHIKLFPVLIMIVCLPDHLKEFNICLSFRCILKKLTSWSPLTELTWWCRHMKTSVLDQQSNDWNKSSFFFFLVHHSFSKKVHLLTSVLEKIVIVFRGRWDTSLTVHQSQTTECF